MFFGFLYTVCLIVGLVFFVLQWKDQRNKVKSIIGMVISFLPLFNLILVIVIGVEQYRLHGDQWRAALAKLFN